MSIRRYFLKSPVVFAIATALLSSASAVAQASATATGTRHGVSPDISSISCSSGTAWVKLSGSNGDHCYTGNGTVRVDLSGVSQERIVGSHLVCVTLSGMSQLCAVGPRVLNIQPPGQVLEIAISSG
jgi:hypothetical protein